MRQDQRREVRRDRNRIRLGKAGMNECGRKTKFAHEEEAKANAGKMERTTGYSFSAYPCTRCKSWHIGRNKVRLPKGYVVVTKAGSV